MCRPNNTTGDELVSPAGRLAGLHLIGRRCPVCLRKVALHGVSKRRQMTVDHLVSWITGGANESYSGNLIPLCGSCNSSKRHHDLATWLPGRLVKVKRASSIRGARRIVAREIAKLQTLAEDYAAILEETEA